MNAIRSTQLDDVTGVPMNTDRTDAALCDPRTTGSRADAQTAVEPGTAVGPNDTPAPSHADVSARERVLNRISAEPGYRQLLYKLLEFCAHPRTGQEIHEWMLPFPEMQIALHTPAILLKWMVQAGGIEQMEGSEKEPIWQTTEAGRSVVEETGPTQRMRRLLSEEPQYREVFSQILQFCKVAKSRAEIEGLLQGHRALENPKIYPGYLIERLESAGGLEWTGKWQTTRAGKGVIG